MKMEWFWAVEPWLWSTPALPLLGFVLWRYWRKKVIRRLELFASSKWLQTTLPAVHWRGRAWHFAATIGTLILLALALARPLHGPLPDHAESKGVDFVIALDVSKSMWVEDVTPNRLQAIKNEMSEWLSTLSGDRMGLVLFAGEAFVQAPITFDYKALDHVLQQAGPQSLSVGGTNIPAAVEAATLLLAKGDPGARFLIIITDGENLEGDALDAVRTAKNRDGINVFTVGVGTLGGGRVPAVDYSRKDKDGATSPGNKRYVSNEYGLGVTSRLDSRALRALAEAGGGRYYEFQPGMKTFDTLRNQSLLPLAHKNRGINVREFQEWFQLPLGCAILLLMLQVLLPRFRKKAPTSATGVNVVSPETLSQAPGPRTMIRARKKGPAKTLPKPVLLPLAFSLLLPLASSHGQSPPSDPLTAAETFFTEGKKEDAVTVMRTAFQQDGKNPWLFYNYALTLYRADRFEEAVSTFQALRQSPEGAQFLEKASIQMGNAQVRLGEQLHKGGQLPGAILALERALNYYDDSAIKKLSADAANNRELARLRLEEYLMKAGKNYQALAKVTAEQLPAQEQNLRHALQAFERAAEVNEKNEEAPQEAAKVREELAQNLAKQAAAISQATDAIQAAAPKKPEEVLKPRTEAVAKLDEALSHSPDNAPIQEQKKAEQAKISDYLTDLAEKQMAKLLDQPKLDVRQQNTVTEAVAKLDQAIALNPENQKAQDLAQKAKSKLEQSHVENGEAALADLAIPPGPKPNTQSRLNRGLMAVSQFEKALGLNAESKPAQEGLKKANEILPQLHADVADGEVAKAQAELNPTPPGQPAGAPPAKPSIQNMQKAVGFLEKADQNFSTALAMTPQDGDLQKRADAAKAMLGDARDQLDQQSRAALKEKAEAAGEMAEAEGTNPQEGAEGQTPPQGPPKMLSMSDLAARAKPNTGDNFWDRKIRDW
jgi:Ca-activated chloride channel homolog